MKKNLFFVLLASMAIFTFCKEDDETFKAPTATAPSEQTVLTGTDVDINFTFTADAGYKSSAVAATKGTAIIKTAAAAGAKSGNIVVTFTAGTIEGAGSVILTITDNENVTVNATAVLDVVLEQTTFHISENITANTTWETGKVYILDSRIAVVSGVTLTIEPGCIVKGEAGTGENASALVIARGATLMAVGTATSPIIFTSVADEIMPGQVASPTFDPTISGLWGGLIILGNAPISADAESMQIEGIPATDQNGLYGGTNATDNSGVIKYVSIRHGGANIGEGNEINGLTLGGVGSGTVIENIEVIANQDDGIEFFGGTVNVSNVIVWNANDDALDTDQAWAGTLSNFVVICGDETDHALEIDGPEGTMLAAHTLTNGSVKGNSVAELGDFRSGARGTFSNIYFFNFADPATTDGRGDLSLSGDATIANFASGVLSFSGLQVSPAEGVALTAIFKGGTDAHATSVAAGANTVGATKSVFANWSWADENGELADF